MSTGGFAPCVSCTSIEDVFTPTPVPSLYCNSKEGVGLLMKESLAGDTNANTGGLVSTMNVSVAGCDTFPALSATVALRWCVPSASGGFNCKTPLAELAPGATRVETSAPSKVTFREYAFTPEVTSE